MTRREERCLLGIAQLEGIHQKDITALMSFFGSAEEAWRKLGGSRGLLRKQEKDFQKILAAKDRLDLDAVFALKEKLAVKLTTLDDPDYPPYLRNIDDPPYMLYYRGELPPRERLSIAVVGARACDDYGRAATEKMVTDLVEFADVHIISGMAAGIDSAAHRAALAAGGFTTAFLGCGIDVVYPAGNSALYRELIEKGCVITEYPFGIPPLSHHFPVRNRLISGLSDGILVVQGRRGSGVIHTAGFGLDQGKNVYAMPGSVFSHLSESPHNLISMGQAKFAAGVEDILEDFIDVALVEKIKNRDSEEKDPTSLAESEGERVVIAELKKGRRTSDELIAASGLSVSELTSFLTVLEMEGMLSETPGNTYMLINH